MQMKGTSKYKGKIGLGLYAVDNALEQGLVWIRAAPRAGAREMGPYSRNAPVWGNYSA